MQVLRTECLRNRRARILHREVALRCYFLSDPAQLHLHFRRGYFLLLGKGLCSVEEERVYPRHPPVLALVVVPPSHFHHCSLFGSILCEISHKRQATASLASSIAESIAQLVWAFFNYWAYCH
ncbi:uncharacterized protein LOC127801387 isoform X2 [Diospyros lotus]|uniref:uncharacterized protein LOC127801387 isoform X1 n=1 Tax=Diospyros lotus TaxID=55363 RepID=UPI002252715E|nr:uncharacterized protein LOC127801387 isoform X1 [Diospyros lotus]XP_052192422.1 uncharacterized protein LOC127801387 isoform X1 [Diospyros lotus]XP_052192424.1 uncharacterized protein LOC127801387 isoform X1 [Diospyros lotus]XP_052192425.1 uncharacterized protein LOC127801387 isoform X1 [Diospyros lotus]XP_052192426.1 uncharacterized protein LOC127801387 isoform X1 [Diospyros lotus]XP_052192427.1 uncharacterized protein LOC127801387 isoform X1 [Diospyros lotus]XP_052192428.1 uncharacterize